MHTLPLLRLASTVVPGICPCQGFLRQLASGLLGITGVCHSARTLGGTAACHQATAASHAQAVFATQPEHGQRPASFLEDLPKQVDQREDRTYTPTPSQIPFAIATADSGGSKASGSPDGLRTPLTEPMQDRVSNQGFASSRCAAAVQEGLCTCEGGKDPDGGCSTDGACSTLPQTQPKGSSFHAKLLRDGTADDTWHSLSPQYADSKLPQWSKWRLTRRLTSPPDWPLGASFRKQLAALGRYREAWGDCLVPRRWWQDWRLGEWVADVRHAHKEGRLTPTQIGALNAAGFVFKLPAGVAEWNHLFHELRRFREEHGQEGPEFKWRDPLADFTNNFAKWYHQQPELFKQRLLLPDQVWKLRQIGWDMHKVTDDDVKPEEYLRAHAEVKSGALDHEFETMYAKLGAWRDAYGTTIVPKQVFDNVVLGAWVHRVRKQGREGRLPAWQVAELDKLLFVWKVDLQSASWHYLLHEARRYKEVHGHAMIPVSYCNPREVGWVQAARWITRNAKLFSKGKLTDKRYQLIRDILGIKFVKKVGGPSRRGGGNRQLAADARPLGPWNLRASAGR